MRSPLKARLIKGLLVAGVVLGFGSGFHHLAHHRHHHADHLTQVCVDAALGQDDGAVHGRHARWVADRCATHARDATAP